jgi:hypothetical protein
MTGRNKRNLAATRKRLRSRALSALGRYAESGLVLPGDEEYARLIEYNRGKLEPGG